MDEVETVENETKPAYDEYKGYHRPGKNYDFPTEQEKMDRKSQTPVTLDETQKSDMINFMKRFYPNHNANMKKQNDYAMGLEREQMKNQGYEPDGSGYVNTKTGSWTSGPGVDKSEYWKAMQNYTADRYETIWDELKRRFPDMNRYDLDRNTNDVYYSWNDLPDESELDSYTSELEDYLANNPKRENYRGF